MKAIRPILLQQQQQQKTCQVVTVMVAVP